MATSTPISGMTILTDGQYEAKRAAGTLNTEGIYLKINVANPATDIGWIAAYGSTVTPSGFLKCDGSAVSRVTYADLFAIIGTTAGEGDGSTTFNLPNIAGGMGYNWFIRYKI